MTATCEPLVRTPITGAESDRLRSALRANQEGNVPLLLDPQTRFLGTDGASEAPLDMVSRLGALPTHY